jgi:hypothetical protein
MKIEYREDQALKFYSVYVGGLEVNDYYLTFEEATKLLAEYSDYDDAEIALILLTTTTKD